MDCRVKPGNDELFVFQSFIVMAGLDPAIHGAARKVKVRVVWYDTAAALYLHLGFRRFASRPLSLYLPLATAMKTIEAAPP